MIQPSSILTHEKVLSHPVLYKKQTFFYPGQNIQRQPTSERCFNNQSKYVDLQPIFNFNFFL